MRCDEPRLVWTSLTTTHKRGGKGYRVKAVHGACRCRRRLSQPPPGYNVSKLVYSSKQ